MIAGRGIERETDGNTQTDWPDTEDGAPAHAADGEQGAHLWEESWDDDDTNDDFAKQLQCVLPDLAFSQDERKANEALRREEMKKVEASKK